MNSINSIIGTIAYPIRIIPSTDYKQKIDIENLASVNEFIVVRRSEKSANELFDEFGLLREDALVSRFDEVASLSMNILGGKFNSKNISFNPKGKAAKVWLKDTDKHLWFKYIWKATYICKTNPIYYRLSDLHNITFPYHKKTDKHFSKLIAHLNVKPLIIGDKAHCTAKSVIKHKPNKLNYWHIEFHLNDGLKKTEETIKKDQVKNKVFTPNQLLSINDSPWADQIMYFALRDCLIVKAKKDFDISDFNNIDTFHYMEK